MKAENEDNFEILFKIVDDRANDSWEKVYTYGQQYNLSKIMLLIWRGLANNHTDQWLVRNCDQLTNVQAKLMKYFTMPYILLPDYIYIVTCLSGNTYEVSLKVPICSSDERSNDLQCDDAEHFVSLVTLK